LIGDPNTTPDCLILAPRKRPCEGDAVDRAKAHDMDGYMFRLPLYAMAFLGGNSSGMAEQQQWLASRADSAANACESSSRKVLTILYNIEHSIYARLIGLPRI
jgi:hypothetical protein